MSENNLNQIMSEHISADQFEFTQMDISLRDTKLETKTRGYLADAWLRFKKNKSSVAGAWIIAFLLLFAILSPIISPYTIKDKDKVYQNCGPYIRSIADKHWGIFDGATTRASQNEKSMLYWRGIAEETGMDPVLKVVDYTVSYVKERGKMKENRSYTIETNKYYEVGIVYRVFSYDEFERIQQWQDENNIQVIYPYVNPKDISGITDNPNIWYKVDSSGAAKPDKDGNLVPVYSKNVENAGAEYHSIRIAGDDGTYVYYSLDADSNWTSDVNSMSHYFVDGSLLCTRWKNSGEDEVEHREWWEIASIENGVMNWTALRMHDDGTTYTATFSMTKVN